MLFTNLQFGTNYVNEMNLKFIKHTGIPFQKKYVKGQIKNLIDLRINAGQTVLYETGKMTN